MYHTGLIEGDHCSWAQALRGRRSKKTCVLHNGRYENGHFAGGNGNGKEDVHTQPLAPIQHPPWTQSSTLVSPICLHIFTLLLFQQISKIFRLSLFPNGNLERKSLSENAAIQYLLLKNKYFVKLFGYWCESNKSERADQLSGMPN